MRQLALVDGRIVLGNGRIAEALFAQGERITQLGSSRDVLARCSCQALVVPLQGRTVLPGFHDSHLHLVAFGKSLTCVDLNGCRGIAEMQARVRQHIQRAGLKPGQWVRGRGWNQDLFEDARMPSRHDLDSISDTHSILLERYCSHVAVLNTLGLTSLGISGDTQIEGGHIQLDRDGTPTGLLAEAALECVEQRMPPVRAHDVRQHILQAQRCAATVGITSVQTDDLGAVNYDLDRLSVYRELEAESGLCLRVRQKLLLPAVPLLRDVLERGLAMGEGSSWYRIGPLKVLVDGSLGARTAALNEPYADQPDTSGLALYEQDALDELVWAAHAQGMQVALHAIGDRALGMAIGAIERAQRRRPYEARHRIVHCQVGSEPLYSRMARVGIMADIQPRFVAADWSMAERRLGAARCSQAYAWNTLERLGVRLAAGSDCPIDSLDPLEGIRAAVTRTDDRGEPPGGWNPMERVGAEQVLAWYTSGGAYAAFEEGRKGTLGVGMLADLVVLSGSPFDVPGEQIGSLAVELTVCGGMITHGVGPFRDYASGGATPCVGLGS